MRGDRCAAIVVVVASLFACAGSRVQATTASGALLPLEGEAAGFAGPTESCPLGGPRRAVGALMTNLAQTCSALRSKTESATSGLFIFVSVEGTDLPRKGVYPVRVSDCSRADDAIVEVVAPTARQRAERGEITLTKVEAQVVEGRFDVELSGGGRARGSFTAPVCEVDWSLFGRPRPREGL